MNPQDLTADKFRTPANVAQKHGDRSATLCFSLYWHKNDTHRYWCRYTKQYKYPQSGYRYTKAEGEEEKPLFQAVAKIFTDSVENLKWSMRKMECYLNLNNGEDINRWLEEKRKKYPQWIAEKESKIKPDKSGQKAKLEVVQNILLKRWTRMDAFEALREPIQQLITDVPVLNVETYTYEDLRAYIDALCDSWKLKSNEIPATKRGQLYTLYYYYLERLQMRPKPKPFIDELVNPETQYEAELSTKVFGSESELVDFCKDEIIRGKDRAILVKFYQYYKETYLKQPKASKVQPEPSTVGKPQQQTLPAQESQAYQEQPQRKRELPKSVSKDLPEVRTRLEREAKEKQEFLQWLIDCPETETQKLHHYRVRFSTHKIDLKGLRLVLESFIRCKAEKEAIDE